jgi:hypothetical protein
MIHIKSRKEKYRIADKRMKATSCTRGFQLDSKTYLKSKNLTIWIIEYSRRNCTLFFRQSRGEGNG